MLAASNGQSSAVIPSALTERLANVSEDDFIKVILQFNNHETDLRKSKLTYLGRMQPTEEHRFLISKLQQEAINNDLKINSTIRHLQGQGLLRNYKVFWIAGMASAEARKDAIIALSLQPAVKSVILDSPIQLIEPEMIQAAPADEDGLEPGLEAIGARDAWAMGFDGTGRIVCNIDTGVDGFHPALSSKFRGNQGYPLEQCWYDPYTHTASPTDIAVHGTHTMGIMLGSDDSDTVGVAPGAQWIAAAAIDRGGLIDRTMSDIISSFQWAADPDDNPETVSDLPDVINNSWGIPRGYRPECDGSFWEVIDNCEALGIVCIFAAGNEGPSSQSLRSPADRANSPTNSFAVGAIDGSDESFCIANFSSRGPSGCDGVSLKPQVVAPGVGVRSSFKDGEYVYMSGTSMAAPHVAGAVAILRQAKPKATVDEIKTALMASSQDLGLTGPDYDYGYGIIDIPAALDYLLTTSEVSEDMGDRGNYPEDIAILNNSPNPFNAFTSINFQLERDCWIGVSIYSILGARIANLFEGRLESGRHQIIWNGADDGGNEVSSGFYFLRMETKRSIACHRMIILK